MTVDEATLNALVDARVNQLFANAYIREKASGTTGLTISPHGYNALFNNFGVEPGIPTTYIGPMGLEQYLESRGHVQMSQLLNPVFGILTGQTAGSGSDATAVCSEDVPTPGNLKMCHQTWPFGEFTLKSNPIRVDAAGALINRSEILDLKLLNNPFGDANKIVPSGSTNLFRNVLTKATVETTNEFKRRWARLPWTGTPLSATYNVDGALGNQYNGMERLVNDSYQDVFSSTACSAANSLVLTFPNTIMQNDAATYVRTMVETYRTQKYLAEQLQIGSVEFAFFMRYQAFLSFTQVWPCSYETYRCYVTPPVAGTVLVDTSGSDQNKLREEMRSGKYLLIDGDKVPVVVDTTMVETNIGNGNFESDVYLLPISSPTLGGQLLYMEYFNYRGPFGMQDIINQLGPQDEYRVSPDGRFAIFFLGGTAFCKQVMIRTRKRIILRAPFLAARIQDARYAVYQHEREWEPGTSFYEDGGSTSFFGPTYESPV